MIILLAIAYYLSAHSTYAQLTTSSDQSKESCGDLSHCRSVWDIIWSCSTTIFACTWLAVHLNVPEQGRGWLWKFARRIGAFVIGLISPEWIIMAAWQQRAGAKKIALDHKNDHWTITHGFFINMGGFMARGENEAYVLESEDIDIYLRNGQLNMTEEDIQDRSKGDILTKGIVVLQTSWFTLQLIARAIQHLPITELEISTLAFAILNGATYALWWNKPLDVQRPITFVQPSPEADRSIASQIMGGNSTNDGIQPHLVNQAKGHQNYSARIRVSNVGYLDTGVGNKDANPTGLYVFSAVGLLFGGIHCIAWVSHFPTDRERSLWHLASIVTLIVPFTFAVIMFAARKSRGRAFAEDKGRLSVKHKERLSDVLFLAALMYMFVLYPIARLTLLVLAFTTLRSLPLDAYTTVQWTTFVPHI